MMDVAGLPAEPMLSTDALIPVDEPEASAQEAAPTPRRAQRSTR
jgi:hypothetical protein